MAPATIRVRGRTYPVLDRLHLGRRDYLVLKNLSGGLRERYQVYDTIARDFRVVLVLEKSRTSGQHLAALRKFTGRNSASFPLIWEFCPKGDHFFVIQVWIWGHDLGRKIRHAEEHPASWPSPLECFQIYRRLAHGIGQIHQETGIVHGDIKPSNVVLVRNRVFIVDFGSAWMLEQSAYRTPGDGRSDAYASPEQHREEPFVDFRSDYFSASVIAYQLLTRQLPYDGMGGKAGRAEYGDAFANKFVPPSQLCRLRSTMRGEFWERIDRILATGLALDANQRFAKRDAWLSEIEALNAMLKLQPKISSFNERLLGAFDWLTRWFRKPKSNL
jgi:serine/threonine protein kinase